MDEMKILTAHLHAPGQGQIERYQRNGGYQAVRHAISTLSPDEIKAQVKQAGLRGRGGAGFLTGAKWGFIPSDASTVYLVCNSDESEPGTFKDRLLIEKDPHQLIEGIILASYAIRAQRAFIYCRGEFFTGIRALNQAIREAHQAGYLGDRILGSDFSLTITVHPGAGAYIAGEETALLNSLEGYRATPRLKPPFPATAGLYGKPTIVNNVETLCQVVHIVNRGADWFRGIGKEKNWGTKIFQVSGHVQRAGCFEFPLGVSMRQVIEAAGGMLPGRRFKACYPGGSSCALLTADDLDIAMDFDTLAARGTALGTASLIVMDDTTDMVQVAHRLMRFYQHESCGKCTPCREGTRWVVQILERIGSERGTKEDLTVIDQICRRMADTSFCPLAVGAAPPVISALIAFREEFEAYIARSPYALMPPPMPVSYPYRVLSPLSPAGMP